MNSQMSLVIKSPQGRVLQTHSVSTPQVRIGRGTHLEVAIPKAEGGTVSWEHALIAADERGQLTLTDLQSTNGTFLNGVRLQGTQAVRAGDVIQLGQQGPHVELVPEHPSVHGVPAASLQDPHARPVSGSQPFGYFQQGGTAPPPNVDPSVPLPGQRHNIPQHPVATHPSPPGTAPVGKGAQPVVAQAVATPMPGMQHPSMHDAHEAKQRFGGTTRFLIAKMQRRSTIRWAVTTTVISLSILGLAVAGFVFLRPKAAPDQELELQALINRVEPSVVTVVASNHPDKIPIGQGSGFLYSSDGIVVTNYHVIENMTSASIVFSDDREVEVEGYLAIDKGSDIAILKIEPFEGMPRPLPIVKRKPRKGASVFALGTPRGYRGSVTEGIVSSVRDGDDIAQQMMVEFIDDNGDIEVIDVYQEIQNYELDAHWIEHTARILPGNSGGPLVNREGEVIGINTFFHYSLTDANQIQGTFNFASSYRNIRDVLKDRTDSPMPIADASN